ncbi:MAG TPA: RecQ family ATP-dependent DNA helicase [Actinomycetales bacterium]
MRRIARERFGWDDLRAGQVEAIEGLLDGDDVLVVMPTGAGKSAVYQVAALMVEGPTVVVSPLIALQHDQLSGLAESGAADAVVVNSAQSGSDNAQAWQSLEEGDAEFVFLAPEQLAKEDVVARLAALRPSLLVVDEAHCIASWGHDFRPDYLRVGDVRQRLGDPVVAALTATAAPPVREEIVERMRMQQPRLVVRGFDRPNLFLEVRHFGDDAAKRADVVDHVGGQQMPGLVYTGTRKDTEAYATALQDKGLRARAYHAGLRAADRRAVHDEFLAGELDVVVATSAFGMGIDKPDVRFVVHAHISESLDSYYQEVGRAGRDGEPAQVTLMYREQDLGLRQFLSGGGPDVGALVQVATAVREEPASVAALTRSTAMTRAKVVNAVNLLELAGVVRVAARGRLRWLRDDVDAMRGTELAVEAAEEHRRIERSRLEMMRAYAETTGCRRQLLLGYFGEVLDGQCRRCDACAAASADADERGAPAAAQRFPLNARVVHRQWGPGVVMHPQDDRVTVLFDHEGYKTLALQALDQNPVLELAQTG